MQYEYKTSLFKRHSVCKSVKLSPVFSERVRDIIKSVNVFASIYNMSEKHREQLIKESIRYSYESNNEKIPDEVMIIQEIFDITKNMEEETTCFCFYSKT